MCGLKRVEFIYWSYNSLYIYMMYINRKSPLLQNFCPHTLSTILVTTFGPVIGFSRGMEVKWPQLCCWSSWVFPKWFLQVCNFFPMYCDHHCCYDTIKSKFFFWNTIGLNKYFQIWCAPITKVADKWLAFYGK